MITSSTILHSGLFRHGRSFTYFHRKTTALNLHARFKSDDASINQPRGSIGPDQRYSNRSRTLLSNNQSSIARFPDSVVIKPAASRSGGQFDADLNDQSTGMIRIDANGTSIDLGDLNGSSISERKIQPGLDRCLSALRANRESYSHVTLIFAPQLSYRYGRLSDFVEVIEEWFARIRPLLEPDKEKPIKVASWLIHLGKLNEQTNGAVRKKLEREADQRSIFGDHSDREVSIDRERSRLQQSSVKESKSTTIKAPTATDPSSIDRSHENPIDLLIKGLINHGLNDLLLKDLNSALTGIRDLLLFPDDSTARHRSALQEVIRSVHRYFAIKDFHRSPRQKDDEYLFAIVHGARSTLTVLKQLDIRPQDRRNWDLFRILCQLSNDGFVYVAKNGYEKIRRKNLMESVDFDLMEVSSFAYIWLYWNRNPEEFADGIWASWYRAFDRILADRKRKSGQRQSTDHHRLGDRLQSGRHGTDQSSDQTRNSVQSASDSADSNKGTRDKIIYFEHALAVAHFYDQRAHFWRIFPNWFDSLKSIVISSKSIAPQEICDLLYSMAQVLSRDPPQEVLDHRLPELLIDLEKSIIESKSNFDQLPLISMSRALWAFGILKRTLGAACYSTGSRLPPSPSFLAYLTRWTDFIRNQEIDRSRISDYAATIMYFLRCLNLRLEQDSRLLYNLVHLYNLGIDHILEGDLTRSISYFGNSCAYFRFDPPIPNIWSRWFDHAVRTLALDNSSIPIKSSDQCRLGAQSVKQANDSHVIKLLMAMLIVGRRFDTEEFARAMPIWERRMLEMVEKNKVQKLSGIIYRLEELQRLKPSCVSDKFLRSLRSFMGKGPRDDLRKS